MKTIEELKNHHAKEIANLERQLAIAEALPVAPHGVMLTGTGCPWVSYKRATFAQALEVFRAYADRSQVRPMEIRRSGCTVVQPVATMAKQYANADSDGCEYGAFIRVHQGEGFGPDVDLIFYAEVEGAGYVRVCVDLEPERYSGSYWYRLSAKREEVRGYRDKLESVTYRPNAAMNGYADKLISWGTGDMGPIKKGADISYLFIFDVDHIAGQLQNISGEFDPKVKGD